MAKKRSYLVRVYRRYARAALDLVLGRPMKRLNKSSRTIREEAARLARLSAEVAYASGDTETAEQMRDLAKDIDRIRLTREIPR